MSLQNLFSTTGTCSISCIFRDNAGNQQKYTSNLQNPNAQGYLPGYSRTAYSTSVANSIGVTGSREACSNLLMNDIVTLFTTDLYNNPNPSGPTDPSNTVTIPTAAYNSCTIQPIVNCQLTDVEIISKYATTYVVSSTTPVTDASYTLGPTHCLSYLTNSAQWETAAGYGSIEYSSSYLEENPKSVKESYTAEGTGIGFLETFNNCRLALFHKENTFPINTDNLQPGEVICSSTNTYYINCHYTLTAKNNGGLYFTFTNTSDLAVLFTNKNNNEQICVYSQNDTSDDTLTKWIKSSSHSYQQPTQPINFGDNCTSITGFSSEPTTLGPTGPTQNISNPTDGSINQCSYLNVGAFFDTKTFVGQTPITFDATISNWQTFIVSQLGGSTSDYQVSATYFVNGYITNIIENTASVAWQLNSTQLNATFYPEATPSTGNWSCQATATMNDFTTGTEIINTKSASQSGNSIGQANIRANVALFQKLQTIGLKNTENLQINTKAPDVYNGNPPCVKINTTFLTTKT